MLDAAVPVIQVQGVTKTFKALRSVRKLLLGRAPSRIALEDVSLEIQSGEIFGLLGPNGAGKTTLVKLIATLMAPDKGSVRVAGMDVVDDGARVRALIGLVHADERSFYWRLGARENLRFFAALHGLHGSVASRRIDELLDLVGLDRKDERRFMHFSTGMRQRLAIARGLITNPPVLLMDEPTRSLDPLGAQEVRRFIRERFIHQEARTIVLATNSVLEAETLCDRVAFLDKGKIRLTSRVHELSSTLGADNLYRIEVDSVPTGMLESLRALDGVVDVSQVSQNRHVVLQAEVDPARCDLNDLLKSALSSRAQIVGCGRVEFGIEAAFHRLFEAPATEGPVQLSVEAGGRR